MIIFESVRYKNLLASGNYWTEIKLNDNQNTLIVGTNGSGKSTMLDALCFGFFGKPFRKINKPQLVNTINKKDCVVEIVFHSGDKKYKVVRGIKPNIFEIYQDDVLLNQDSTVKDYQEILEKYILKFNFKSFTQIVILGSASFTPFMQLSTADRRSIIEDILDIQIFSSMNTVAKDKLSNNKDLIVDKKYQIELLDQKYQMQKKHLQELRQDHQGRIDAYQSEIDISMGIIESHNQNIKKLTDEVNVQQEIVGKKDAILENLTKLMRVDAKVEGKKTENKNNIDFYNTNDVCPTCKQNIDIKIKGKEIDNLTREIEEFDNGLVKLRSKIKEEQDRINVVYNAQKVINNLQIQIASINSSIMETSKYISKIRGNIQELTKLIQNEGTDDSELKTLAINLNTLRVELGDLIEKKSYYEAAINLLKDTGIKTKIIKQYLPLINRLVNKYLVSLDFFVNFNLDESFKETIKSRHRDDFTYNNFSEGEKLRIDMALMLTWREVAKIKNSAHTNLLILDEIFDSSLDDVGVDYLLGILHSMEDINIHVISHKGDLVHDRFDRVVRFDKVKNFSKIKK